MVFNGEATIGRCIESVLQQDHDNLEYIIIDGCSTDGTKQIIESYGTEISKYVCETDQGIYDAMNKGIAIATGEIIGILNADDFYASNRVISQIAQIFEEKLVDACYADLHYVDAIDSNKVIRKWVSGQYNNNSFLNGWMPPHPTFFLRNDCYKRFGNYRLDFGSAADYELMLRMIKKNEVSISYLPEVIVKMQAGGVSNSSFKNRVDANKKDRKAWQVNGLKPRFYSLYLKPLRKLIQFF